MSPWQAGPAGWRAFLEGNATGPQPQAFVARNFLIDEGLSVRRADSYRELGAAAAHADSQAWRITHESYLEERVFRRAPATGLPSAIDDQDDYVCPETFRDLDPDSLFVAADPGLLMLRIEDLPGMERVAGASPGELKPLAAAYLGSAGQSGEQELRDFLGRWAKQAQLRPTFAAFYADLETVLESGDGWEDRLRDAVGLIDFDPGRRGDPIDVLIFRYPNKRSSEIAQPGSSPASSGGAGCAGRPFFGGLLPVTPRFRLRARGGSQWRGLGPAAGGRSSDTAFTASPSVAYGIDSNTRESWATADGSGTAPDRVT